MMKNKKVFDVSKLDIDKYARSELLLIFVLLSHDALIPYGQLRAFSANVWHVKLHTAAHMYFSVLGRAICRCL